MTTPKRRRKPKRSVRAWFTQATLGQWIRRLVVVALAAAITVVALLIYAYSTVHLPPDPPQAQTTIIRDAKGNQLADLYKGQNRVEVSLNQVADVMEHAVVSAEDRHFYQHGGIDPIGTARALLNDLRGRHLQGGSTITQQLVKNTYLTSERSLTRKFREAILAVKVEHQIDKREILQRYLNTIYFGRGAYGVEKAAELYFGIPASKLDLEQATLLAGLIRAPEAADPATNPAGARQRRALVLDAMVRAKAITRTRADEARAAPLGSIPRADPKQTLHGSAAYFAAMVQQWTVDQFGERQALSGGLRVDTTLDPDLQAAAQQAITSTLDRPDDPDAALVTMSDDGAVLAMIGGKDFQRSQVNLATTHPKIRPQAGSTFKPFVLAAALANGVPLNRTYAGPAKLTVDFKGFPPYPVVNFDNESFGPIDLTEATAQSVNTVYAQLASDVGPAVVAKTAHDLGIDSDIPIVPSVELGTANVAPIEMLRAYMTFANRGKRIAPYFVKQVTDADGNVLYSAHVQRDGVYPQKYADAVNAVLQQVIKRGTGKAADIGRPAAGKTGTTNDSTDAWFIGYTPRIGTAVWMGYAQNTSRRMNDVHGREVTGGSFPAQIWQRFMSVAVKGRDTGAFTTPDPEVVNPTTSTTAPPDTTSTSVDDTTTTTDTSGPSTTTTTTTTPHGTTTTSAGTTTSAQHGKP